MSTDPVAFGAADLTTCDREPIHIPGSIQSHGVLLVVDRRLLTIEQTAGDTERLLGIASQELIGRDLSTLFDVDIHGATVAHLASPAVRIAPILSLGIVSRGGVMPLDFTLSANADTALLEFEPANRAAAGGDAIAHLKQLLSALAETVNVEQCCIAAAAALRAASGFDRAMVYRFEADESGVVVAEDREPHLEPFLGLHYPASDIPQQARELYLRNWLRAIPDVHYLPAALSPTQNPRTAAPIDLRDCGLRSVSPIHLEYLRNMGVAATTAMSVICDGRLWGMLILHHYTPRYIGADLRVACETFAQVFSLQVNAMDSLQQSEQRLCARRIREMVVSRLTNSDNLGAQLASRDLLSYVNATGMVAYTDGKLHRFGFVPDDADIMRLIQWLGATGDAVYSTDRLAEIHPPAAEYKDLVCGLLAIALTRASHDYVLWFRAEYETTVRWAGDPSKPVVSEKHGTRLTPRGSFAEWRQLNRMHSRAWSEVDLESADALRVVLLESVLKAVEKSLHERDKALRRQNLLLAELDHRVRNALGKIEAAVVSGAATAVSVQSFSTALSNRIEAMAQTHTLLAEGKWVGTSLRRVIEDDVVPTTLEQAGRLTIRGDDIFLTPLEALALSMVLHEMMTNAVRHGALSVPQGAVSVEWNIDEQAGSIVVCWNESGVPQSGLAGDMGTGIGLITRTIEEDLHGSVEFNFAPDGLRCELRLPVGDASLR